MVMVVWSGMIDLGPSCSCTDSLRVEAQPAASYTFEVANRVLSLHKRYSR